MKKAFHWLETQGIEYQFHDYKKSGMDAIRLAEWCEKADWETLLNKRGLTWRKLPDANKQDMDVDKAIRLMVENPSLVKRPVLEYYGKIEVGFSSELYTSFFSL